MIYLWVFKCPVSYQSEVLNYHITFFIWIIWPVCHPCDVDTPVKSWPYCVRIQRNLVVQPGQQTLGTHLVRFRRATVSQSESKWGTVLDGFQWPSGFPRFWSRRYTIEPMLFFQQHLDGGDFLFSKSCGKIFPLNLQGALCKQISGWGHICYESGVLPKHQLFWEWYCQPNASEL